MQSWYGPVTIVGTGLQTISLSGISFTPNTLRFKMRGKNGANAYSQLTDGFIDSTGFQRSFGDYAVPAGGTQHKNSNAKCMSHWEVVAGVLTEIFSATFNSYVAGGFKLNVATNNSSGYQLEIEAEA